MGLVWRRTIARAERFLGAALAPLVGFGSAWSRVLDYAAQASLARRFGHAGRNVVVARPDSIIGHEHNYLGENVHVLPRCRWEVAAADRKGPVPPLTLGSGLNAGYRFHIACSGSVTLGSNVLIANNVFITDTVHNYEAVDRPIVSQGVRYAGPVVVEDGCWLGYGAVVLPRVTIGRNSVVGAGAAGAASAPPFSDVVGNAACIQRGCDEESGSWESV